MGFKIMRKGRLLVFLFMFAFAGNLFFCSINDYESTEKFMTTPVSTSSSLESYDSENLVKLSEWDRNIGQMKKIFLFNEYAFIACQDGGLQIFSYKILEYPSLAASFENGYYVSDVFVRNDLAYLCCMHELVILNVSNLQNIVKLGETTFTGGGNAIDIEGDYAFIAVNFNGLLIFDIANPSTPTQVSSVGNFIDICEDLEVVNDYAFVCHSDSGLNIFDVSNPNNPFFVKNYAPSIFLKDIVFSGDIGFIAGYSEGVHFVNFSDPVNPSLILTYVKEDLIGDNPRAVSLQDNLLFIVDGGSVHQIDISNISNPLTLPSFNVGHLTENFAVENSIGFLLVIDTGLFIVNFTDHSNPSKISQFLAGGDATDVWITDNYAVVNNEWGGISFIDVSDLSSPEEVSSLVDSLVTVPHAITGNGSIIFIANGDGLLVVNASDMLEPKTLSTLSGIGVSRSIAFSNNRVFLPAGFKGLAIVDVSNPIFPVLKARVNVNDIVTDVYVKDNHAFVTTYESGVKVIDVSSSNSPEIIRTFGTDLPHCYAISGFENRLFVSCQNVGIAIYNIESLTSIPKIKTITSPDQVEHLSVQGDWLYVTEFNGGLTVLNWHNFTCPFEIAHFNDYHHPGRAFATRDIIYYPDGLGGLKILKLNMTDKDNDYLPDYLETLHYCTDPTNSDSDADGILDGLEAYTGTDPLDPKDPYVIYSNTTQNIGSSVAFIGILSFYGLVSIVFFKKRIKKEKLRRKTISETC